MCLIRSNSHVTLFRRERSVPLTPEEKDARTIFCMQLAARIRSRDLEEFFSAVGKVSHYRITWKHPVITLIAFIYQHFTTICHATRCHRLYIYGVSISKYSEGLLSIDIFFVSLYVIVSSSGARREVDHRQ